MTAAALLRRLAQPAIDAYRNTVTVTVPTRLLTALADQIEAAEAVSGWWVMRSIREGVPLDGETGESKVQARALNDALAEVERAAKEHTSQ